MAAQTAGLKRFYTLLAVLGLAGAVVIGMLMRTKPVSIPANVTVQVADTAGFRGYLLGRAGCRRWRSPSTATTSVRPAPGSTSCSSRR